MSENDSATGSPEFPAGEEERRRIRRLGEQVLGSLLDSGAAIGRGQRALKEEIVRMLSQELRGFLDKMDVADLVQEIMSGMVLEVKTEVRFRREEEGGLQTKSTELRVRSASDDPGAGDLRAPSNEPD